MLATFFQKLLEKKGAEENLAFGMLSLGFLWNPHYGFLLSHTKHWVVCSFKCITEARARASVE
jgi:hypothetical protein